MPLFCIACDRVVVVRGEVYEWLNAPAGAHSIIYLDSIPGADVQAAPIPGVEITLERWPSEASRRAARMKSDRDGLFGGSLVVGPGGSAVSVAASAVGFRSVERPFQHEGGRHAVRVLLAPEK